MEKIIVIAIIIFIFRGPIFSFLGWIFEKICDLIEFGEDIGDNIARMRNKRRRKKYDKIRTEERRQRLVNIDAAYAQQNYKEVISLYRRVMADQFYPLSDKMEYCHIAADCVCHVANTISEYEEARTWTMIIKLRGEKYAHEADQLFKEITAKGKGVLEYQDSLLADGYNALDSNQIDKAKALLKEAADNGSFAAICSLTNYAIGTIEDDQTIEVAKKWIEKVKCIDEIVGLDYKKKLDNSPVVKCMFHFDKASAYDKKANELQGDSYIDQLLKAIKEWEKAYESIPVPEAAKYITEDYVRIAEMHKKYHGKGNDSFKIFAGYYEKAFEWSKLAAQDGDEKMVKLMNALESQVKLNNIAMEITEKKANN